MLPKFMKRIKPIYPLEYLCPTLILSYFLIHNIFLVLIGIGLSLYFININFINNLLRSINKILVVEKETKLSNNNDKAKQSDHSNIGSDKKDSKLTLVETIEELGFIPSLEKNDNNKAA
tara:strand:- start:274 stop:630 length:357 start_codon:yes stop_codon:yes gene_type:complete